MGGGYIDCGDFSGDDKSGSAISGVFEELHSCLPADARDTFEAEVMQPIMSQLEENEGEYFLISPSISARLLPEVETLFDQYQTKFGDAEVWDVIQRDQESGIDSIDAKYGKGAGWRYYCLTDLRIALRRSIDTDTDVSISFD